MCVWLVFGGDLSKVDEEGGLSFHFLILGDGHQHNYVRSYI